MKPNALLFEKSPYLLQHAYNPVSWRPWGDAAFREAREADRPIFLSIGYATCHWCHVMERESFEDLEVATFLNDHFIPIKVDREERPDVDAIYMQSVIAQTGQGGWPLSVFLTPALKPFFGGTYFPPRARWGRPGFIDVLKSLSQAWTTRRADVQGNADWLSGHLAAPQVAPGDVPRSIASTVTEAFLKDYDATWGGFGGAPKFPRPSILAVLAHEQARRPSDACLDAISGTLAGMARGGLRDQVGGGFARYSTDERWLVPHFEKMLYDNAQLLEAYLDGFAMSKARPWLWIAEEIALWCAREMTHPLGGFFSAEDADSEGEEGRFYVMTISDMKDALGDEDAALAARIFGMTEEGNFESSNVLHLPHALADIADDVGRTPDELHAWLTEVRRRIYVWRHPRVHPITDDKILLGWNGLMIAALARLGAISANPRWTGMAERAVAFIESHLVRADGRLLRRWRDGDARFEAGLDDYAAYAYGLTSLFSATGNANYLGRALQIADACDDLFRDDDGAYFSACMADDLIVRMKESSDGALPSGNALLALVHARLGAILGDESRRAKGNCIVSAFGGKIARAPHAFPLLAAAAGELAEPPRTFHVVATSLDSTFLDALAWAHNQFMPGRVIVPILDSESVKLTGHGLKGPFPRATPGAPVGQLCENGVCKIATFS